MDTDLRDRTMERVLSIPAIIGLFSLVSCATISDTLEKMRCESWREQEDELAQGLDEYSGEYRVETLDRAEQILRDANRIAAKRYADCDY